MSYLHKSPSDIVTTHNEYNKLLREYQDAKQAYELDDSKENWDSMQEALKRLNRHTAVMDVKRV